MPPQTGGWGFPEVYPLTFCGSGRQRAGAGRNLSDVNSYLTGLAGWDYWKLRSRFLRHQNNR